MADVIRLDILEAIKEMFEDITVANGYRNTITTVEMVTRCHDDPNIGVDGLPWIGFVPQKEIISDTSFGENRVDWPIWVLSHFHLVTSGVATALNLATACSNMFTDIRRKIYENPTLGVEGVTSTRVTGRIGSEGSAEAVRLNRGSVQVDMMVRFREDVDAA